MFNRNFLTLFKTFSSRVPVAASRTLNRPAAYFSSYLNTNESSVLEPEERPNYYNVYDDDEIFETPTPERDSGIENESRQTTPSEEPSSGVFNSTFDDEVL